MITRLANAIEYPAEVPTGASSFAFHIDDSVTFIENMGSRLILRHDLELTQDDLSQFAVYASGRMLREEAVLGWDERSEKVFLWREIPSGADAAEMRLAFEDFLDSCDWWESRVGELHAPRTVFPDIMIKP